VERPQPGREPPGKLGRAPSTGPREHLHILPPQLCRVALTGQADLNNVTPLLVAAYKGHVDQLLRKGTEENLSDSEGRPLLYLLMLEDHVEMAGLLLEHGTRLEGRDLPLSYGADVDALDKEGHLALHQSSWQGHGSTAHLLLARGAQPNHSCSQGATTQGVAMQEGWADVVKVLLTGARLVGLVSQKPSRGGFSPLGLECWERFLFKTSNAQPKTCSSFGKGEASKKGAPEMPLGYQRLYLLPGHVGVTFLLTAESLPRKGGW
uniref:Uncharacterized protein n=1 Tax=Laticauda laticaudata TaxID=8630 RepID=A0A8C5SGI5_LATLA